MTTINSLEVQPQEVELPLERETLLNNWPLQDVLSQLVAWAEHLHNVHNCDCDGWEARSFLIPAAKIYAANSRADLPRATAGTPADTSHPEHYCHKCGGPNVVWFAPNATWDKVVRKANEPGILCPTCFIQLAEAAGFYGVWKVALHDSLAPPRATGETTVESALAELREMFPSTDIQVTDTTWTWHKPSGIFMNDHRFTVLINHRTFHGKSASDCMAQVRAANEVERKVNDG